jgi:hypothetical protein
MYALAGAFEPPTVSARGDAMDEAQFLRVFKPYHEAFAERNETRRMQLLREAMTPSSIVNPNEAHLAQRLWNADEVGQRRTAEEALRTCREDRHPVFNAHLFI